MPKVTIDGKAIEVPAKTRIIEAAKNGESDPARLYEQALKAFDVEDLMLVVSVGRDPVPAVPAYALVTQAA